MSGFDASLVGPPKFVFIQVLFGIGFVDLLALILEHQFGAAPARAGCFHRCVWVCPDKMFVVHDAVIVFAFAIPRQSSAMM